MIATKQDTHILLNNNGSEYYTIKGLELVHAEMLRLVEIVDDICQKNEITYWLDGGTLIGAIRHKGFIPWDDDFDISLLKKDYIKLLNLLDQYSSEKKNTFILFPTPQEIHCCNYFASNRLHSRLKGSLATIPVKIDIRPLNAFDNTPESLKDNLVYRDIANQLIFNKTNGYASKEQISAIKTKSIKSFFNFYNNSYGMSDITSDNTLLSHPYFEFSDEIPINITDILPIEYVDFETIKLPVPKNYDQILIKLYGKYTQFPPLENRVPVAYEILITQYPKYFTKTYHNITNTNIIQKIYNRLRLYTLGLRFHGIFKFIKIMLNERK